MRYYLRLKPAGLDERDRQLLTAFKVDRQLEAIGEQEINLKIFGQKRLWDLLLEDRSLLGIARQQWYRRSSGTNASL